MWGIGNKGGDRGSRPIRRTLTRVVRQDPATGLPLELPLESQETTLSPEGSPDTVTTRFSQFHDCGHSIEFRLAGKCYTCRAESCELCHRQCAVCEKPVCPECSRPRPGEEGSADRLCELCAQVSARKRLIGGVLRFLVSPFVSEEKDGGR